MPPITIAVPVIMMINIAVYFVWLITANASVPSEFMLQNFMVNWTSIEHFQIWTLVTSVFSHHQFWHLFLNMYVLASFGDVIEATLGTKKFVTFYLLAGVVSSLSHCLVSTYIIQAPDLPALGASGAISGLILLFSLLHPREKIFLFGFIPVAAAWGSVLFIGIDLWGVIEQKAGGGLPIGHGAHLGGALTGIVYYFAFLKKKTGASILRWRHSAG